MPIDAKPLSLTVRPFQVAHLCFEVGGILGRSFAELGTKVSAFSFDLLLYAPIRGAVDNGQGRLELDSNGINQRVLPFPNMTNPAGSGPALAALRAESLQAALNKAIIARENAFITKYGGVAAIADAMRKILPSRGQQIRHLSRLSFDMKQILNAAYEQDEVRKGNGVVTATILSDFKVDIDEQTKKKTTTQVGETRNTTIDFRAPLFENLMRNERAQIGIGEEAISWTRETHYLDRIEEVFKNELAMIDADVNQLQHAYLNTILLSPIDGIVTGVYKNPGDWVSPGEPVFRVENNADVLIVAKVGCRGPISVGSMMQVNTTLFDLPDSRVFVLAEIVAVRGAGEDDQWEVIAKCKNVDNAGKGPLFPLGYTFDYDNTTVTIFGLNEI